MTSGQIETFRAALKEARSSFNQSIDRLQAITKEEDRLKDELTRLRRTITALAAMCSESPWDDALGITESCMEVMESEYCQVSTQQVVSKLEDIGFDFSNQKNPAASVHAVLSRLATKKKIGKITNDASGSVTWRGPKFDADYDSLVQTADITDDDIPF